GGHLVMPMVAGCRRRIHRDDDLRLRLPHHTHDAFERVVVAPGFLGQWRADGVVEVDLVKIVDMLDAGLANRGSLLALADDTQRRTLLGPDGVAAALAAGDRDHANLESIILVPLAVG